VTVGTAVFFLFFRFSQSPLTLPASGSMAADSSSVPLSAVATTGCWRLNNLETQPYGARHFQ